MSKSIASRRPAESGAMASALALLVARGLGVDDVNTVTALAIAIGGVPAAITWWVETQSTREARKSVKRRSKK